MTIGIMGTFASCARGVAELSAIYLLCFFRIPPFQQECLKALAKDEDAFVGQLTST